MDVFGRALKDFTEGNEHPLTLNTSYGDSEEMPTWYLFREYDEMSELEKMALSVCEGTVLDVGAGTGVHSLVLQRFGHEVWAIETSKIATDIMKESGVRRVECLDFFKLKNKNFDTLLLLMNGIGIIGTLNNFNGFLDHAKSLLNDGGQLIFDSSDIKYLYEGKNLPEDKYYGEVSFQYEYQGEKGDWFNWVYIDQKLLADLADEAGWYTYILHQDNNDQFLARMIPK